MRLRIRFFYRQQYAGEACFIGGFLRLRHGATGHLALFLGRGLCAVMVRAVGIIAVWYCDEKSMNIHVRNTAIVRAVIGVKPIFQKIGFSSDHCIGSERLGLCVSPACRDGRKPPKKKAMELMDFLTDGRRAKNPATRIAMRCRP